jgi:signal transduction histidine kinase
MGLLDFLQPTILPGQFERSVFALVRRKVTDKRALGEELAGAENLERIPSSEHEKRQKMAAELYLLLERNISQEQARNRIPPEVLRTEIFNRCHANRAEGNFALFFLPHYERQIKLFERFANIVFARAKDLMGEQGYMDFMKSLESDPILKDFVKNSAIQWGRLKKQVHDSAPAVQRDTMQNILVRAMRTLVARMIEVMGEMRTQIVFQEIYRQFHEPITFIDDAPKVLLLLPDDFLPDERIGLMGKAELEEQLRLKNKALETTLAEVQGEKLKLSTLTREELEKKVQERTVELVSALTAAEQARKNLEEFSSLATHELRTPVAAVKGYLNLIAGDAGGTLTDQQKKYMGEVVHVSERLLTLVNAMLDVSRIELGTLAVEPESVFLPKAADEVLAELSGKIKEKNQEIIRNFDATVPTLMLDPSMIHAIFMNLISNAVKYTPERGKITISIQKRGSDALLAVEDTGMGIPKEQQSKMFQKLFRADNARTKIAEGTGLGLYLVKSILDQTGGKIWFASEEDKGSTFFVAIPMSGMQRREGTKGLS